MTTADASNADQLKAWDGDEGSYWAKHADAFDAAVRDYRAAFLAAAAVASGDRVLDVGCGNGETTLDAAAAASAGSALGVDLSGAMLDVARERAHQRGVGNVTFEQVDAQVHAFTPASYDVVMSRTGAMFFGNQHAAFANLANATKPGGRLVLLVWQPLAANEWIAEIAAALSAGRDMPAPPIDAPGPFRLSDPAGNEALLTGAGWSDVQHTALSGRMRLGATVDGAHGFIAGLMAWMLDGLDDAARAGALEALRSSMQAHLYDDGVSYASGTWLIKAVRG